MAETGWVRLYQVRDGETVETADGQMRAVDWLTTGEEVRLKAIGRKVETTHSRATKTWTLKTYVPDPPHTDKCGCVHREWREPPRCTHQLGPNGRLAQVRLWQSA